MKSVGEPPYKSIQGRKRAFGTDDCAEQYCVKPRHQGVVERMIQEVTSLVRCLGITIRTTTAVQ